MAPWTDTDSESDSDSGVSDVEEERSSPVGAEIEPMETDQIAHVQEEQTTENCDESESGEHSEEKKDNPDHDSDQNNESSDNVPVSDVSAGVKCDSEIQNGRRCDCCDQAETGPASLPTEREQNKPGNFGVGANSVPGDCDDEMDCSGYEHCCNSNPGYGPQWPTIQIMIAPSPFYRNHGSCCASSNCCPQGRGHQHHQSPSPGKKPSQHRGHHAPDRGRRSGPGRGCYTGQSGFGQGHASGHAMPISIQFGGTTSFGGGRGGILMHFS